MISDVDIGRRLTHRIILAAAIGIICTSLIVSFTAAAPLYQRLRQSHLESIDFTVRSRAQTLEEMVARQQNVAMQISSRTKARQELDRYNQGDLALDALQASIGPILLDALDHAEDVAGITRLDAQGRLAASVGVEAPPPSWPTLPDNARQAVLDGLITIDSNQYSVVASPILDRSGRRVGVDVVLFRIDVFQDVVSEREDLGATGELLLCGIRGQEPVIVLGQRTGASRVVLESIVRGVNGDSGLLSDDSSGELIGYRNVRNSPWAVVYKVDAAEFFTDSRALGWTLGAVVAGLSVVGAVGAVVLLRPLAGRVVLHTDELEREIIEKTADVAAAHDKLERANRALVGANEDLRHFSCAASHDLKSPLFTIEGYAGVARRALGNEDYDDVEMALGVIGRTCQSAAATLQVLLEFMQAGETEFNVEVVELKPLLESMCEAMRPRAEAAGATIECVGDLPSIHADRHWLERVLENLLSNAIRYGCAEGGEIRIGARDHGESVEIFVQDTGPGIATAARERIFRPFERLDGSKGGSGIGLSVCQRVVERHHGRIWVEDTETGATIAFSLPRTPYAAAA